MATRKKRAKSLSKKSAKKTVKKTAKKTIKKLAAKTKSKVQKAIKPRKRMTKKNVVEEPIILQPIRGMRDILPGEQPYWQRVRKVLEKSAIEYGYARIDTPLVEFENLFTRPIGVGTDIVEKEMYIFKTKGKDLVTLRPELTVSIARAYIQHGMNILPKPVKLFSMGQTYRYDRPQEGSYREFHQASFEIFGEDDPILDAQVIQMAARVLKSLGIKNIQFQVNSVGTADERDEYLKLLRSYFNSKKHKLSKKQRELIKTNPMRLFDSKDDKCVQVCAGAPQLIDHLDKESHAHFKNVLEYLDELDLPYTINPTLVRGFDYYTRTVFEIYSTNERDDKRYALGGGGRYDRLTETLGGEATPAIGLGFGMDRLVLEMKRLNAKKYQAPAPRVFLAQLGVLAKKKSLTTFAEIEKAGILVAESFGRGNLKSQLRHASKLGVDVTLIIGQKEALDDTIIVKNMLLGTQETVEKKDIVAVIKKCLKSSVKVIKKGKHKKSKKKK
jgi:histidyl-tRNA synthetase